MTFYVESLKGQFVSFHASNITSSALLQKYLPIILPAYQYVIIFPVSQLRKEESETQIQFLGPINIGQKVKLQIMKKQARGVMEQNLYI